MNAPREATRRVVVLLLALLVGATVARAEPFATRSVELRELPEGLRWRRVVAFGGGRVALLGEDPKKGTGC